MRKFFTLSPIFLNWKVSELLQHLLQYFKIEILPLLEPKAGKAPTYSDCESLFVLLGFGQVIFIFFLNTFWSITFPYICCKIAIMNPLGLICYKKQFKNRIFISICKLMWLLLKAVSTFICCCYSLIELSVPITYLAPAP